MLPRDPDVGVATLLLTVLFRRSATVVSLRALLRIRIPDGRLRPVRLFEISNIYVF